MSKIVVQDLNKDLFGQSLEDLTPAELHITGGKHGRGSDHDEYEDYDDDKKKKFPKYPSNPYYPSYYPYY